MRNLFLTRRPFKSLACLWCVLHLMALRDYALALDTALDVDQYAHTAWRAREGFTKCAITAIAQTMDGYLWLGTECGLLRFDGVRNVPFESLTHEALPDSYIRSLLGARDGTLWIGTLRRGVVGWKSGRLTPYPQLAGQGINALLEDRAGTVWAGTQSPEIDGVPGRLCAIHAGDVRCVGSDGGLGQFVASLHEDTRGTLWMTSATGLWRWQPGALALQALATPVFDSLQGLADGGDGTLLITTRGGITRLADGAVGSAVPGIPGVQPQELLRDRDGGVWIATSDGVLHVHDGRTDAFRRPDGLTGALPVRFFEDHEGNIWVATLNGLDRFRNVIVPTYSMNGGLSDAEISAALASRDGSIWMSTRHGLQRWRNGELRVYGGRPEGGGRLEPLRGHPTELSAVRETFASGLWLGMGSLFEDDRGRVWIGTKDTIGYLEDDRYVGVARGGLVQAITQDAMGYLWLADRDRGLLRVSQNRELQQIPWSQVSTNGPVARMAADPKQGGLWLGFSSGGVARFVGGEVRTSYFPRDGLAWGSVHYLRVDDDGTLWVGAHGGLSRVRDGRIATLDASRGLPCGAVDWMIDGDDEAVWVYTACGIARIARTELADWGAAVDQGRDPREKFRVTVLDSSDGVASIESVSSYSPHVTKSSDGRIWFPTYDGVAVLDPRHLPHNRLPPPVHVEEIIADRRIYGAAPGAAEVHLPPLVRDLQVDYTALSLAVPEKVLFRYKLEGRDRDWQEAGNRRRAFYTDLAPGNYRFRVIASNNSRVWNEQGAALDFSIAPAYWQTLWFRALCVGAILLVLWAMYLVRLRRIARAFNARLEERVAERTRIARELHDTLLQNFQGLLLRFQTVLALCETRPAEAREVLRSSIDQTAQAITAGREAVQGLRASTIESNDLAQVVTTLGEQLAAEASGATSVGLQVEVEGTPRNLHPIVRDEIYRIASEALRNAFRHAEAHQIEVEFRYDERQLRLRVRDDGKGIDATFLTAEGRPGHFGLYGMRERAELLGGKLTVWTAAGSGAEIELVVPAARAYAASRRRSWFAEKFSGKSVQSES